MATEAPIIFEAVNDQYSDTCRITAIVWTGSTTAGDTAEIRDLGTGEILWSGIASGSQTYIGVNLSPYNVGATGLRCSTLASGKVFIYLANPTV